MLVLRPEHRVVESRGGEYHAIRQWKLELDAQPTRFQSQVSTQIDNLGLSHLAHHVERRVFTFLAEHPLEDLKQANGGNDQSLNGENRGLELAGIWSTVNVFEPSGRIDYVRDEL